MSRPPTDVVLWDWRYGQTQAERLCADLLHTEGYADIDPQAPLGGPDGRKDILCTRDGQQWLAAVYFPPTRSEAREVRAKFVHDLEGALRYDCTGFAFFTNQPLTPGQRAELTATAASVSTELYHQERIRSLLDSPKGYGARLQYLRIPMSEEEQHALWSTLGDQITERLVRQEAGILELHRKLDVVLERTMRLDDRVGPQPSSMEEHRAPRLTEFPTADLQVADILWLHRVLTDGVKLPKSSRGRFRASVVWIGSAGSMPDTARFVPVAPDEIGPRLDALVKRWRIDYPLTSAAELDRRLAAVTAFHHEFLTIHPFLDGNGRVARALLQQQILELTGRSLDAVFTDDPETYFKALSTADAGDISDLKKLIQASVE